MRFNFRRIVMRVATLFLTVFDLLGRRWTRFPYKYLPTVVLEAQTGRGRGYSSMPWPNES